MLELLVIGDRASLPLVIESMLVITRQLMTLAIRSNELADGRENKGNAMPVKTYRSANVENCTHYENAQMKESNRSARSSHALKNAH